ncbi:MAG: hypothetical protein PF569_00340 [Candidatus Woesearchaeota archaeon]|jgi:hypothetical protein|nr:hypothetical protein [Candidatus Woesearchaeota archaeon]
MNKFRVNKGEITIPIEEFNLFEDLNIELKEKEIELKQLKAKLESEYQVKVRELEEKKKEINKLIEDNMLVGVSNITLETRDPKYGTYECFAKFTNYTIMDSDLETKILTNNLEAISNWFVTNFDKLKFLKRLEPNEIYKCFNEAVEQATGIKL